MGEVSSCHQRDGWGLTGYARGLREVALHRARVMCYGENDIYSQVYRSAASEPTSWNHKSASIFDENRNLK